MAMNQVQMMGYHWCTYNFVGIQWGYNGNFDFKDEWVGWHFSK